MDAQASPEVEPPAQRREHAEVGRRTGEPQHSERHAAAHDGVELEQVRAEHRVGQADDEDATPAGTGSRGRPDRERGGDGEQHQPERHREWPGQDDARLLPLERARRMRTEYARLAVSSAEGDHQAREHRPRRDREQTGVVEEADADAAPAAERCRRRWRRGRRRGRGRRRHPSRKDQAEVRERGERHERERPQPGTQPVALVVVRHQHADRDAEPGGEHEYQPGRGEVRSARAPRPSRRRARRRRAAETDRRPARRPAARRAIDGHVLDVLAAVGALERVGHERALGRCEGVRTDLAPGRDRPAVDRDDALERSNPPSGMCLRIGLEQREGDHAVREEREAGRGPVGHALEVGPDQSRTREGRQAQDDDAEPEETVHVATARGREASGVTSQSRPGSIPMTATAA